MYDITTGTVDVAASSEEKCKRRTANWLLSLALVAILGATLFPIAGEEAGGWVVCLVCGDRSTAGVLLNVMLFVPLGAALALRPWPTDRCVLAAALLSASIEVAQLYIPGRDSSLGDVLSNTSGAIIGILLVRAAPTWIRVQGKRAGHRSDPGRGADSPTATGPVCAGARPAHGTGRLFASCAGDRGAARSRVGRAVRYLRWPAARDYPARPPRGRPRVS